jgi:hypothetical protein
MRRPHHVIALPSVRRLALTGVRLFASRDSTQVAVVLIVVLLAMIATIFTHGPS